MRATEEFTAPETNVYFAVVSSLESTPVLDSRDTLVDWQASNSLNFDYTLTLTGVTPYRTLLP